jgi:prepilin-type N-terminal cleavage/methylation domain-containing protein
LTKSKRVRVASGFTLIEILLVLALIGLMAGLVAGNAGSFIAGANFEPPERVLKKAVLDAVYFAGERKRSTYLSFIEENASFLVTTSSGVVLSNHLIFQKKPDKRSVNDTTMPIINFQAIGPLSGAGGGRTSYDDSSLEMERIPFHSGSSVPFLAKVKFRDEEQTLFFDPFSGYAIKEHGE